MISGDSILKELEMRYICVATASQSFGCDLTDCGLLRSFAFWCVPQDQDAASEALDVNKRQVRDVLDLL